MQQTSITSIKEYRDDYVRREKWAWTELYVWHPVLIIIISLGLKLHNMLMKKQKITEDNGRATHALITNQHTAVRQTLGGMWSLASLSFSFMFIFLSVSLISFCSIDICQGQYGWLPVHFVLPFDYMLIHYWFLQGLSTLTTRLMLWSVSHSVNVSPAHTDKKVSAIKSKYNNTSIIICHRKSIMLQSIGVIIACENELPAPIIKTSIWIMCLSFWCLGNCSSVWNRPSGCLMSWHYSCILLFAGTVCK